MRAIIHIAIVMFSSQLKAINNNTISPKDFIAHNKINNQWISYKVPAQENTQSMCCLSKNGKSFNFNNNNNNFKSCDLNNKSRGYGTNGDSPITENINIFVQIEHNKVEQILSVGDACQVNFNGQSVSNVENVDPVTSIDFLKNTSIGTTKRVGHDALYAISHHQHEKASKTLFQIATQNNNLSENAVFWLGEARNDGIDYLIKLYKLLPFGKVRQHINFALTLVDNTTAIEFLKDIGKNDKDQEQRADALFWLSQGNIIGIENFLLEAVNNDRSRQVQEKAVFSLSQIETIKASEGLLDLAENHLNKHIRNQALFWLVEIDPYKAKQIVLKKLINNDNHDEIEHAVFTLHRLEEKNGDEGLFEILKGNYSNAIKKKALFWIAQSDNKDTIDRLQSML
jgi:hypothetical protein